MNYRLVITVTEPNPSYQQQLEEYDKRSRFGGVQVPYPTAEREVKKLETVLSEAEFVQCRDSILARLAR